MTKITLEVDLHCPSRGRKEYVRFFVKFLRGILPADLRPGQGYHSRLYIDGTLDEESFKGCVPEDPTDD